MTRAKRAGLVRNAALVLGDRRVAEAVPALGRRLADVEEDPVVRAAAAWRWDAFKPDEAIEILRQNQRATDALVREAVARALAGPGPTKGIKEPGKLLKERSPRELARRLDSSRPAGVACVWSAAAQAVVVGRG